MTKKARRPRVTRFIEAKNTNSAASLVDTDQGRYVIKPMNNPDGPAVLVAEWIGSSAARWLGVPVADFGVVDLGSEVDVLLSDAGKELAKPGACFGSRFVSGEGWQGEESQLKSVDNQDVIPGLVLVDTWVENRDRYFPYGECRFHRPENVHLATEGVAAGQFRIMAIDFGYALGCPLLQRRDLPMIEHTKDGRIYGLFPAFRPYWRMGLARRFFDRLATFGRETAESFMKRIPAEWGLTDTDAQAVASFLCSRARFLADKPEESKLLLDNRTLPGLGE